MSEFVRVFYLLFSYDNHSTEHAFLVETVSVYCEAVTLFLNTCYIKVKVKAVCGSYSTDALRHIVLLPK